MKNTEDQLNDELLKDLFRRAPMESPGTDFVANVMAGIQPIPASVQERKPFFNQLRSWWPYILAAFLLALFFTTSDFPFSRFIPGKAYFADTLIPHIFSFFAAIRDLFGGTGNVSFVLIALSSGLFLFLLDRFLFRRFSTTHFFSF